MATVTATAEMLGLRHFPDAVLALPVRPVTAIDRSIALLAQDMAEVMYRHGGSAITANQIGITKSVFIYDADNTGFYEVVINPVLSLGAEIETAPESCLSVPNRICQIERSTTCVLTGYDLDGKEIRVEARGELAQVFQHELDHLDGVLIIDRAVKPDSLQSRYGW